MGGKALKGIIIGYLIFLGAMAGIGYWAYTSFHHVDHYQEPLRNEIERGIEVKQLENKFVVTERVFLGGAGAGGLGAPQVFAQSAQQFSDLVPSKETVYVAVAWGEDKYGDTTNKILKKTYWAFIENRAGLLVYDDYYSHDGFTVVCHDDQYVFYEKDNGGDLLFVILLPSTLLATLGLFVVLGCAEYYDQHHKK